MADVEKVIKQLETVINQMNSALNGSGGFSMTYVKDTSQEAIQTIRELQSTEDKMCEYSIKDDLVFDGCRKQSIASTFSYFNECEDFNYCPYCGRKIKVVE